MCLSLVSACCFFSYSNAQVAGTLDPVTGIPIQETGNLVSPTGWTGQNKTGSHGGANPRDQVYGCCTGGPGALVDTSGGSSIWFSYSTSTVAQSIAINNALSGTGIKVSGVNYGYQYYNQDNNRGTLSSTLRVTNSSGVQTHATTASHEKTVSGWTAYSNTVSLNRANLSDLGTATLSFTGKDDRFWAGYYGPAVTNPYVRLAYTVDPCILNPASSPDCAGFADVITSPNIAATSYAINTALNLSGSGVMVHGLNYGFRANFGAATCSAFNLFGWCLGDWINPSFNVTVNVTDSDNKNLYQKSYTDNKSNTSSTYNSTHLLPQSRNLKTLGNYQLVSNTSGAVSITDTWSNWIYTPDPCVINPLSSPTCEGYAQAYFLQQCTANPLSSVDCPGYAAAYKTQQCTANALFDPTCPGYEVAYFNQQCSLNPLYNQTCPGYEVAYFNQQCSLNSLYNVGCPGYAQAFFNQECKKSALYNIECPGYQEAYFAQQCSLNPLYNNGCPGYAQAYLTQQCNITQLFSTDCPLYKEAYFNQQCTLNPLYDSKCVGYAEAFFNQQCTANALYNTQCPGYAKAFFDQQCGLNPLYNTGCPLYQQAYLTQQCNLNQLYSTSCPGYQQAYFNQQCGLNTLYNPGCPGYAEAYRAKLFADSCQANPQANPQCPGYRTPTASNTTQSTNLADAADPVKSITENPLVADPVTNAILTATVSKTDGTGTVNVVNPPSALGQGLQVPGLMPGVQLSPPPRASRSTTTQSARTAAAQQAIQQARTLSAEQQKEEATMAAMATVPGFDAYQNAVIPDARFYVQEQIYRRANLPDNQRAQRALSQRSDRLHQQMVDQLYNLVGPAR